MSEMPQSEILEKASVKALLKSILPSDLLAASSQVDTSAQLLEISLSTTAGPSLITRDPSTSS